MHIYRRINYNGAPKLLLMAQLLKHRQSDSVVKRLIKRSI